LIILIILGEEYKLCSFPKINTIIYWYEIYFIFWTNTFFASYVVSIQAIMMNTSPIVHNYFVTPVLHLIRYQSKQNKEGDI
jgi:hypothetical protein